MAAVTTLKGHVSRAMDFYNKREIYLALGKTTPWNPDASTEADKEKPPVPNNTDDIVEVFGYKRCESVFLVKEDDAGQLTYRNKRWAIVPYEDALDEGARWVYLATYVEYNELPTDVSYRQIGTCTSLVKADGIDPGKYALLPTDVVDPGILEVLDNRTPIYREPDQREHLKIIIEF